MPPYQQIPQRPTETQQSQQPTQPLQPVRPQQPTQPGWRPPNGSNAGARPSGDARAGVPPGGATAAGPAGPNYGSTGPAPYDPSRPPYPAGGYSPAAGWPATTSTSTASSSSGPSPWLTRALLALAALLSLAYAAWAFTARRGIFADFADGRSVSVDDAKSSDLLDTVFLLVAGLVALIALGLWLSSLLAKKTSGGLIDKVGLALAMLGALLVIVGLFLASGVTDAGDQIAQGEKGVTATWVVGGGFVLLAIGLLMGLMAVRDQPDAAYDNPDTGSATPYPGW